MKFFKRFKKPDWSKISEKIRQSREKLRQGAARFKINPEKLKFERFNIDREKLRKARQYMTQWDFKKKFNPGSVKAFFNKENLRSRFEHIRKSLANTNPDELLERGKQLIGNAKAYSGYLRYAAAGIAAYFVADTVSLFTGALIPDPPVVPPPRIRAKTVAAASVDDYRAIYERHIFSSKGLIPEDGQTEDLASGPARKSTLPFNLIGTVVLADELKSIAAIEDKTAGLVFPVRIDETIEGKAKITKIEHLKVFFINKQNGHLEYIEIIDEIPILRTAGNEPSRPQSSKDGVTRTGANSYQIERNAVDKATENLHEVLRQARAIPNFENGKPAGYKLLQIVPGSIYDQLGLKNFDVICGINGEPITDPGKAFQLFQGIKDMNNLELCIKRGGRKQTMNYEIR